MIRRVLFCGAWDEGDGYPRATALREGLRANGVQVDELRAGGLGRKKQGLAARPWRWPGFVLGSLWRRLWLRHRLRAVLREQQPDVVVVPYPGHHLVRDVAAIARVPVVLDLFLSAYDTAVVDRRLFAPQSLPARLLKQLDRRACAAADLVLVDTDQNAAFVADLVDLPAGHFATVPIADPQAPPSPVGKAAPVPGMLRLLFFGTGVPLHGLAVLIDAVAMAPGVQLALIGGNAEDRANATARLGPRLDLGPEFADRATLQQWIAGADLVAGVFGSSDKARRVVPFKVVHALAAGRAVITAATDAVRDVLRDGDGAFLVPAGDASALAARLRELVADPTPIAGVAARARAVYDQHFAVARTGERLRAALEQVAGGGPR